MKKLQEADIHSKQEILKIGVDGLVEVPGIGKKTAEKIVDIVKEAEPKPDEDVIEKTKDTGSEEESKKEKSKEEEAPIENN
jgi:Holliday junction resolvasome RuvABC DNA-binding subunit